MGVQELLLDYLKDLEAPVKRVLLETIVAEQEHLDLERPKGVRDKIRDIVEREAGLMGQEP